LSDRLCARYGYDYKYLQLQVSRVLTTGRQVSQDL
jgi:hypothetical protein